jgi:hypothetical protein
MSAAWLEITPVWITAVASLVTAFSIIFLWRQATLLREQAQMLAEQLKLLSSQVESDHERSRKELTISLMEKWATNPLFLSPLFRTGSLIVHELNPQEVECIRNRKSFEIDEIHFTLVQLFRAEIIALYPELKSHFQSEVVNHKIRLSEHESYMLNAVALRYLNQLETVAAAWRLGIADRESIELEFDRIVEPKNNRFNLENYRLATDVYPSIQALAEKIKQNRRQHNAPKPTLPINHTK